MKNFIIYNANGQILRTGNCSEKDFNNQVNKGEYILEGIATYGKHYIKDNKIVDLPEKTEEFAEFNYDNESWILDAEKKIDANKLTRNSLLYSSDWTQLADVALTETEKQSWRVYRQALRDMTEDDFLSGNFPIYK